MLNGNFISGKMTIDDIPVKAMQTYNDAVLYVVKDPVGLTPDLVKAYLPKQDEARTDGE